MRRFSESRTSRTSLVVSVLLAGSFSSIAVTADGTLSIQPRIVGGMEADDGEYASFVHGTNTELCGGSLIHPDIVLTAAHCEMSFSGSYLILGSNNVYGQDGAPKLDIDFLSPHPQYTPGPEENDIMLIKLKEAVASAPLMPINKDPSLPTEGQPLQVIGFGRTEEGGEISNDLLEVTVDSISMDLCQAQLPGVIFEESHICAGGGSLGGKDSCEGDSGGPLLDATGSVQYGIVTFGVGCARPFHPGVYTRVSYYADWIDDFICEHSSVKPDHCHGQTTQVDLTNESTEQPAAVTDGPVSSTNAPPTETVAQPTTEPPSIDEATPATESPEPTRDVIEEPNEAGQDGFVSVDLDNFKSSAAWRHPSTFVVGVQIGWLLWHRL